MTTLYKIHGGLIDQELIDRIQRVLFDMKFPWNYHANTNYEDGATRANDVPQFVHGFVRDGKNHSELTGMPLKVVEPFGLKFEDLLRAKANLVGWEKEPVVHPAHTDDNSPHFVVLYYANESDGETILFPPDGEEVRVSPQPGRILCFHGHLPHASSSPVQTRYRAVLNINVRGDYPAERFGLDPLK